MRRAGVAAAARFLSHLNLFAPCLRRCGRCARTGPASCSIATEAAYVTGEESVAASREAEPNQLKRRRQLTKTPMSSRPGGRSLDTWPITVTMHETLRGTRCEPSKASLLKVNRYRADAPQVDRVVAGG